ncbi:Sulfite exporter TauE/SafE family protein 3 [Hondaea fermentalgiana]|uniref:Sulfite exporter TauE/SafE family protein 3 n=1 Tax=Hondaea fermentalgiana TaxID=2315210 RepID=A0A2R5G9D3_9STRA|nr:Sulfite exporter TauE/SafE family protein 3 [Hondaea fermentalgiana]|eukprot:GBG26388.1 Sulfite exporter TauE/SafE family protein 3 [Hondaea fermentalgiana]
MSAMEDLDLDKLDMPAWRAIVNFVVIFLCGTLAGASGVGGGAIYVPLYITLFGLVYEAIPLSKAAVCGAALAFFVFNVATPVPRTTKHANRFAYDVVMVMEPATLLGTVFGVLASRMCPYWLITAAMASLLAVAAFKTFKKGRKLYDKENEANAKGLAMETAAQMAPFGSGEDRGPLIDPTPAEASRSAALEHQPGRIDRERRDSYGVHTLTSSELAWETDYEYAMSRIGFSSDWMGWRCLETVGICYIVVLLAAMFSDDEIMPEYTRVDCGTLGYWLIVLVTSLVCAAVTTWNVKWLARNVESMRYQCAVSWDESTGARYALLCLVAGFASALCGIGGSTIKGPILLEMGLHPTLSKATSQVMLLSTVSSSAFQFFISGELPPYFGLAFFGLGALSGFTGKFLVDWYVERDGRQSTIVYLLAWYIVIAAVIMTSIGVIIVLGQVTPEVNWDQLGFRGVCDPLPNDMTALRWLTTFSF